LVNKENSPGQANQFLKANYEQDLATTGTEKKLKGADCILGPTPTCRITRASISPSGQEKMMDFQRCTLIFLHTLAAGFLTNT
jgi:hypothetical protein